MSEIPVIDIEQGTQGVHSSLVKRVRWRTEFCPQSHDHEQGEEGGHQATDAVYPKSPKTQGRGLCKFRQEQTGNEESGEHKKDIDAEKSTSSPAEATVEEQHQKNCERSNAIEARQSDQFWINRRVGVGSILFAEARYYHGERLTPACF